MAVSNVMKFWPQFDLNVVLTRDFLQDPAGNNIEAVCHEVVE